MDTCASILPINGGYVACVLSSTTTVCAPDGGTSALPVEWFRDLDMCVASCSGRYTPDAFAGLITAAVDCKAADAVMDRTSL